TSQGGSSSYEIPEWVKNNAGWWADGQIPDSAFVVGIEYLIKEGIIQIN
ncbi:peptidase, partial [Candidatus Nitrosopelagicus sp.]|nr:peptidase [Candidatus Nitrosopelagicus sp.]